jgi:uncharacterized caspase-like protein
MLGRRTVLTAGAAALVWPGVAGAQTTGKRLALTIGNNAYSGVFRGLRNAGRDAEAIAAVLGECRFNTVTKADAGRDAMERAIKAYAADLAAAGTDAVGFFYFAGHGAAALTGENFLIASGEHAELSQKLWTDSIDMKWLVQTLSEAACPQIIAIDACRNTLQLGGLDTLPPEKRALAPAVAGSFANIRGLRLVAPSRANQFISFATWEGETVSDGADTETQGPYSKWLTEALRKGERTVRDLFDDVRLDVLDATMQAQEPMNLVRLARPNRDMVIAPPGKETPRVVMRAPLKQALVVSCKYGKLPQPLESTAGDAARVAEALDKSGFDVTPLVNPDKEAFEEALFDFAGSLKTAGKSAVGVVYFAGIGASLNGDNYLIPEGELPKRLDQLREMATSSQKTIELLERAKAAAVVVLIDCGRVLAELAFTPEERRAQRELDALRGKALQEGFAQEYGRNGVLLAYATSPGQKSLLIDGGSPYSKALATEILRPQRRNLEEMLRDVSRSVDASTNGGMTPYLRSSVKTPIYFRDERDLESPT